ncbi:MAG: hypothetical protein KF819_17970 [Labilithrix sp.]|nr:hypothetical protein [Labilithrix sp.]
MSARALAVACLAVAPVLHCARADESARFDDEGASVAADAAVETGVFADGGAKPIEDVECAEDTKQIYVLGTDKALYRFYPDQLKFVRIGIIGCPTNGSTFSMAIDRRGIAWVEYTDGRLFAVDTGNATCKPTAFRPGQTGFSTFGMGFARNGDGPNAGETLYAAGAGLASIDTKTFELKFLGSLTFGRTELTGLDTQLFAFSVGSGVIAGLNKANAATEVTYRTSAIDGMAAFAFAHWGGDFWIFTGNERSQVTRYSPSDDTSIVPITDTGMLIVGAGSSTCAPTKRPR